MLRAALCAVAVLAISSGAPSLAAASSSQPAAKYRYRYVWGRKSARVIVYRAGVAYDVVARGVHGRHGWRVETGLVTRSADGQIHRFIDGSLRTRCRLAPRRGRHLVLGYTSIRLLNPPTTRLGPKAFVWERDRSSVALRGQGSLEVDVAVLPPIPAGQPTRYGKRVRLATVRLEIDARGRVHRVGVRANAMLRTRTP